MHLWFVRCPCEMNPLSAIREVEILSHTRQTLAPRAPPPVAAPCHPAPLHFCSRPALLLSFGPTLPIFETVRGARIMGVSRALGMGPVTKCNPFYHVRESSVCDDAFSMFHISDQGRGLASVWEHTNVAPGRGPFHLRLLFRRGSMVDQYVRL